MAHFTDIAACLVARFGQDIILEINDKGLQPSVRVLSEKVAEIGAFLYQDDRLFFDFLACITGIDNGPVVGTMEVIYHFTSLPFAHNLTLKTLLPRNADGQPMPSLPSLSHLWRTADWHEREIFDLLGINFENHPDLRRILLPADWQGHPLRKDYEPQKTYHGIEVKY